MGNEGMTAGQLLKQANRLKRAGRLDEAIADYQRVINYNPNLFILYHNLGEALAKKGFLDEAVINLRQAIKLKPNSALSYNFLGEILLQKQLFDEATECFRKAIDIDSTFYKFHDNLGLALAKQEKFDEAVECFQKAIEIKPDFSSAYYNLGDVLSKSGKSGDASVYYSRAAQLNPIRKKFYEDRRVLKKIKDSDRFQVKEAITHTVEDAAVWAFYLDSPQLGETSSDDQLLLKGWVLTTRSQIVGVEVVYNDAIIKIIYLDFERSDVAEQFPQIPKSEKSGFQSTLNMAGFPEETILHLSAVCLDGSRFKLFSIKVWHRQSDDSQLLPSDSTSVEMGFTGERFVPYLKGNIRYEHLHRYALCLEIVRGKSALDIASGEGYGSAVLSQTADTVVGVDLDGESIKFARKKYNSKSNLEFLEGSCDAIPLADSSIDVVVSFETIEHHDRHEEMMQEIKRVLKKDGLMVISSPNRLVYSDKTNYQNPYHVKELYQEELVDLLHRYFQYVTLYGQKLAMASFIYSLDDGDNYNMASYTSKGEGVAREICSFDAPLYFVALCSDNENNIKFALDSLYLEKDNHLLL